MLDYKHLILSHLIWVGVAIAAVVGFYFWRAEHDQRLVADRQVKAAQAQIATLRQGIAQRDAQARQQAAPVIKIVHDVVTVPQAVAALPQVVNQPLPTPVVPQPNNAVLIPEPDIIPLFDQVADDKVCRLQLDATQKDLVDEKAIAAQKDNQVAALNKKPGFWRRVWSVAKKVGIGIAIGALGAKLA